MKTYTIKEFAELINVSIPTLRLWDRKKWLIAHRTPSNRYFYTQEQYEEYFKRFRGFKDE